MLSDKRINPCGLVVTVACAAALMFGACAAAGAARAHGAVLPHSLCAGAPTTAATIAATLRAGRA